ncbi:prolow-density lipoprotein receptor-related protein 1-like [Achroia grisella]|uniref:prolow-density lipoprotein receptor-related protein 1-like n=1 Tax=Achroia grisella TaxID=688607 RepID=UPI0027D1FF43|nr:prolow-density lipoprotein receptor-related protein 1-like [Achroia grisella]
MSCNYVVLVATRVSRQSPRLRTHTLARTDVNMTSMKVYYKVVMCRTCDVVICAMSACSQMSNYDLYMESEAMCSVSACSHECRPSPGGAVCACPAPLYLQADRAACGARPPCAAWGVCSQRCRPHKARHRCACHRGYRLADDGFTCKSTEKTTPLLVYSNRHEIRAVELPAATSRALISSLKNTIALDWRRDPTSGAIQLYWTDVVDDKIYRGTMVGSALSGIEVIVEQGLSTAEGLAVDWIAGNLYWVESSLHQIEVARLDGKYRRTLIAGGMENPRAIAADPRFGYLFWSDWEQAAPRIERASLSGTSSRALAAAELSAFHYISVVTVGRLDTIHTATYEGSDFREVVRRHAALSHPFAVTVFESHVYWTDWRTNSVARANKWNGSDVTVVQRTLTQPFDIKVIHPSRQPPSEYNPCGVNNGNCTHLCLIDSAEERVCACPHVMRLAADNVTCEAHEKVLLVGRRGEVRGLDVQQPLEHTIPTVSSPHLTAPSQLHFLAADRAIYWADAEANEIKRTGLTGGGVRVVADSGVESPRGFALDWAARLLYFTTGAALAVVGVEGHHYTLVYEDSFDNVSTLAVDPIRGSLYWARQTAAGWQVETAQCDGSRRRVLLDRRADPDLAHVHSMVVDHKLNRIYWVNTASATIQYIDRSVDKHSTLPLPGGSWPAALEVYGEEIIWANGRDDSLYACRHDGKGLRLLRNNTPGVMSLRVYDAAVQRGGGGACSLRTRSCAQLCVPVSRTDSVCLCAVGYRRNGDACEALDEVAVVSLSWEVVGVALNASADSAAHSLLPPVPQLSVAAAIDYHAEGEWLYWADSEAGRVWRVRRDGTQRQLVVQQPDAPDAATDDWRAGLAVDWAGGAVYWSDPRRSLVLVARLDGSHAYVLLDTDPLAVTALAVDAGRGWLFLAGGGWVQRARPDGSHRDLLYNGTAVADIALDTQNEMVYWADTWEASVWRMRYDGSQRTRLPRPAPPRRLAVAALAVHRGTLYWLDTMVEHGSLLAAPVNNMSDYRVLRDKLGDTLKDIFIWSRAAQSAPGGAAGSPCAGGGGCAALCLWDGARPRCVCPHGDLAPDGHNCTPYKSFLMYSRVTSIESIHLTDEKDLNSPYPSIQNKRLYWTNWNESHPCIQRAYTSGQGLQTIVSTDILMPNGLALDHAAKKIYWADARLDKIERMNYDGSHRHVVVRARAEHPFGVAVCGGWVYWSDWVSHAVYRADKLAGGARALRRDVPRPMALVAVAPHQHHCAADPCAVENGGCAEKCSSEAGGAAKCACGGGRRLAADGRACAAPSAACAAEDFACAEGPCVPQELVCDGLPHCSDSAHASDEDLYYCTSRECPPGTVRCGAGGRCVSASAVCDGRADCDDAADEDGCDCPPAHYRYHTARYRTTSHDTALHRMITHRTRIHHTTQQLRC